ncbi:MAG: DUF6010 family protein [Candidatus Wenzhouxiangella sp. M2_3B_020]
MTTTLIHAAWLVAGLVLGLVLVRVATRFGARIERMIYAVGLVVVAAVYPVLAGTTGADDWLMAEIVAASAFLVLAVLGSIRSPLWLSGGWVLHAAWDSPVHLASSGSMFVPVGYILACAGFDLVVALAIYLRYRKARRDDAPAEPG